MVLSSMHERGPLPKINIPEDPSRFSHTARKFVIATFAGSYVADQINNLEPGSFDFISPLIEDHIGNFPSSFAAGCIFMNLSNTLLYKAFKDETAQKLEPILPIISMTMVVGLNMVSESLVNPNPEIVGDVTLGVVGGVMGVAYKLLSDRPNSQLQES